MQKKPLKLNKSRYATLAVDSELQKLKSINDIAWTMTSSGSSSLERLQQDVELFPRLLIFYIVLLWLGINQ